MNNTSPSTILYIFTPSNPNIPVLLAAASHRWSAPAGPLLGHHWPPPVLPSSGHLQSSSLFLDETSSPLYVILRSKLCHELTALDPRSKLASTNLAQSLVMGREVLEGTLVKHIRGGSAISLPRKSLQK
jgi:hypothetical protein